MIETEDAALTDPDGEVMPLVSVVVPCFNHAAYVEKAIASVLGQTYPAIELIVVDDGSSDASPEVLRRLADQHGFTLVLQENRGVCRTLNRGIRAFSKGEYIALLASDDLWREDKIAAQMALLRGAGDARLCFSQAVEFADDAQPQVGRVFPRRVRTGQVLDRVFLRQHVPAGTLLFERRLFDELGGFDEALKEEDWDFVIRSAAVTPFAAVPAPLLCYRAHAGNTMRTRSRRLIFEQKARILTKNMALVSPWRWLASILFHFTYDIVVSPILRRSA